MIMNTEDRISSIEASLKEANKQLAIVKEELISTKLETGKWYFYDGDTRCLLMYSEGGGTYGWWDGEYRNGLSFCGEGAHTLATREEVEGMLIKEAKKRGYAKGNFKSLGSGCISDVGYGVIYDPSDNEFWNQNGMCFKGGKWADIIEKEVPELTLAEVCKELGREVKIIK